MKGCSFYFFKFFVHECCLKRDVVNNILQASLHGRWDMLRVLSVITAALFLLHFTYIHVPRLVFLFSSTSCTKFVQQEYIKKVFTSKQDNESIKQNDDDNGNGASSISRSPVFSLVHYFLNFILSLSAFSSCAGILCWIQSWDSCSTLSMSRGRARSPVARCLWSAPRWQRATRLRTCSS